MRGWTPISRRRLLAAGAAGFGAAALAACGESEPALPEGLPKPPTPSQAAQARAVAAEVTEAAPRDTRGIPAPGAQQPVTVAFPALPDSVWGFGIEPLLLSAGLAASAASERRYRYESRSIADVFKRDYSLSARLDALPGSGPELVMFHAHDLPDLLAAERLLPLDSHLQSDAEFDRGAFWPGVLDTGARDGVQYALPVAVAPWTIVFNRDLAAESGIETPDRQTFDREAFLQAGLAMQGGPSVEGREHGLGFLLQVDPRPGPGGDYASWPPAYVFMQAALGNLRGGDGTFQTLRSAEALEVVQFFHDMAHVYGFAPKPERSGNRVWLTYTEGSIGMWGESIQGTGYAWLRAEPFPNQVLLPFPSFGGGAPADVWTMIGVSAAAPEPTAAYDAMRALERALRRVAFVPAVTSTPQELGAMAPGLLPEEVQMLADLMPRASYIQLSRRERSVLTNAIDAGIVLESLPVRDVLLNAATDLAALSDR